MVANEHQNTILVESNNRSTSVRQVSNGCIQSRHASTSACKPLPAVGFPIPAWAANSSSA